MSKDKKSQHNSAQDGVPAVFGTVFPKRPMTIRPEREVSMCSRLSSEENQNKSQETLPPMTTTEIDLTIFNNPASN